MNARVIGVEFLGSFTYVVALFSAILSVDQPGGGLLAIALAPGLAFAVMHYVAAPVSGGHFNPAVTLGLGGRRTFPSAAGTGLHFCTADRGYSGCGSR